MLPATYEIRYGPFTTTTYTLTAERLVVETRGGVGGASADIPVPAITGFFAVSRKVAVTGPRGAVARAGQELTKAGGELIVVWAQCVFRSVRAAVPLAPGQPFRSTRA